MARYRWTLVSIPFSHYNERARWALELASTPYRTVRVMPMLHVPVVAGYLWWVGHKRARDKISSPLSTPLFMGWPSRATASGGRRTPAVVLDQSGEIVTFADREAALQLYPSAQLEGIREVETVCHDTLGPMVRVIDYYYMLPSWSTMSRFAFHNVGVLQAALFTALFPIIRFAIRRGLSVNEPRMHKAAQRIKDVFGSMSDRLTANAALYRTDRPYLCGNTFTAADLTFASLAALVVGVTHAEGFGAWIPSLAELPPPLRAFQEDLRATPAGQHILRMYREHRRLGA